jgi:hypothetical protein
MALEFYLIILVLFISELLFSSVDAQKYFAGVKSDGK